MAKRGPYKKRENVSINKQHPISEMCAGCARDKGTTCEVINEPSYIYEHRGACFARVDEARAKEIEKEIKFIQKGAKA